MSLEPIPSLFSPSPLVVSQASVPTGAGLPMTIRTKPEQWTYAVQFTRSDAVPAPGTALLIRVSLCVTSGSVGVGCLNRSETEFVDETFVTETTAPTTVDVLVARPADAGPLIIRNASPIDASEVSVLGVQCFAVAVEDDAARTPGLSDPRPCARWSRYYGTLGDTIREKSRVQTYRSLGAPLVLRWADGMAIRILPGEQLSRALFVSGTYEPNTLCALRSLLQPGDTFIDVGANTGVISLVASRWVGPTGRIYSFEPSRREYDNLLANVMQNAARNVTPVRAAVTSASGSATLRVAPSSHAGLNTLGSAFPYAGVDAERMESVETITLDAFAERQSIDRVAVIKLDVEGGEGAVLQGSRRLLEDHRPAIIAEIMARSLIANGTTVESLERLLKDAGYRLFVVNDSTATLESVATLDGIDEQNIIALPSERC